MENDEPVWKLKPTRKSALVYLRVCASANLIYGLGHERWSQPKETSKIISWKSARYGAGLPYRWGWATPHPGIPCGAHTWYGRLATAPFWLGRNTNDAHLVGGKLYSSGLKLSRYYPRR